MANSSSGEERPTRTSPPSSPPDDQLLPAGGSTSPTSHPSGPGAGAVAGGEVVTPGLLIGESSRKRGGEGGPDVLCSICGKGFVTAKAMFGHMRSHRDRGWRGAHPPPAFRADEEFADILHLLQQQQDADPPPSQALVPVPDPVPVPDAEEEGEEYGPGTGAGGRSIPDLNLPLRERD